VVWLSVLLRTAEAYCTYQPPSVRIAFIAFQCLLPGVCGLLAAWGCSTFPLSRSSHGEIVAGIAAHKDGDGEVTDPLTNIQVPVPDVDPVYKAAQAAYDHYSDAELRAASVMSDKESTLALLKGSVTKRIAIEVSTLLLMLIMVLVTAAEDTSGDMLWLSASVTVASLTSSLVIFLFAFDIIRLQHVRTTSRKRAPYYIDCCCCCARQQILTSHCTVSLASNAGGQCDGRLRVPGTGEGCSAGCVF